MVRYTEPTCGKSVPKVRHDNNWFQYRYTAEVAADKFQVAPELPAEFSDVVCEPKVISSGRLNRNYTITNFREQN